MKILPINLIAFSLAFIFFTIFGTLTHEYGHVIVAKYLGYQTELHYGSMNYTNIDEEKLKEIYLRNESSIQNNTNYPEKRAFENLSKNNNNNSLLVTIGGPLATIIIGTIGFIILLFSRKKSSQKVMKVQDWLFVFLSLFWLREIFNLVMSVSSAVLKGKKNYFGGDEKNIAQLLEIPSGSIAIPLAFFGLAISSFVIFKIIPKENRFNFILSGLFGGIIGYILWLRTLGPILMP